MRVESPVLSAPELVTLITGFSGLTTRRNLEDKGTILDLSTSVQCSFPTKSSEELHKKKLGFWKKSLGRS